MDRRITSRLNMANAVKEVCDTRTDVVALVPAFVLLVATLKDKALTLRALMKQLSKKTTGLAERDRDRTYADLGRATRARLESLIKARS